MSHSGQNTGLRINLPKPDCSNRPTDCQHIDLLNQLDGFNVQPRLSVPFSGPIDVKTVDGRSILLVRLGSALDAATSNWRVIEINQIVWDVATNTLHVEPDQLLEQHTRYALLVTKNLLDAEGKAVKAAKSFLDFVDDTINKSTGDPGVDAYRTALRDTLRRLDAAGVIARGQVVAATVFTTQSVTAVLEKIRDQIKAATPEAADFNLGPGGTRTVFPLVSLLSGQPQAAVELRAQTGAAAFTTVRVFPERLGIVPDVVDTRLR